jgi:hypothetical protein
LPELLASFLALPAVGLLATLAVATFAAFRS